MKKPGVGSQEASEYEGLQDYIRRFKLPKLEAWKNKYPDKIYTVNIDIPEFTSICPHTGLPDFAVIKIEYQPAQYCIELKSLKLYTIAYRNLRIYNEHVANKIMEDFVSSCKPRWVKITAIFNARGGIATTVIREYRKKCV
jgi:7-cyano-7-deazaguanine reductase